MNKKWYKRDIMQLLSVKTTISKEKKHSMFSFAFENMKKLPTKVAHNWLQFFFQYCQQAQNQRKFQFLFHKNCSPSDFWIITLDKIVSIRMALELNQPSLFLSLFLPKGLFWLEQ